MRLLPPEPAAPWDCCVIIKSQGCMVGHGGIHRMKWDISWGCGVFAPTQSSTVGWDLCLSGKNDYCDIRGDDSAWGWLSTGIPTATLLMPLPNYFHPSLSLDDSSLPCHAPPPLLCQNLGWVSGNKKILFLKKVVLSLGSSAFWLLEAPPLVAVWAAVASAGWQGQSALPGV